MTTKERGGRRSARFRSPRQNSMTTGEPRDSETIAPVNAECASTWGDRPTPGSYVLTVSWSIWMVKFSRERAAPAM
jgi:hypothetical protein